MKRRGENAYGIVLYCIILGASFTFVNGMGMVATQLANPGAPGIQQIAPAANCGVSASGLGLNCAGATNLDAPSQIFSTGFATLGYFVWGFLKAIPLMVQGIGVPGSLASLYFGSGIGIVVNAAFFTILAFWAWEFVANRNTRPE